MKSLIPAGLRGLVLTVAVLAASCSSSLYDVRHANSHRSASGLFDSYAPRGGETHVSQVYPDSDGPLAYLLFVNLLRAPFIPLIGALELASPVAGAAPMVGGGGYPASAGGACSAR